MREQYVVAENAFTISVPDGLAAWAVLEPRFRPFAASSASAEPVLTIDVEVRELPESKGEMIYDPAFDGIGIILGRAFRLADGSLEMEFTHVSETEPRVWMKMSPDLGNAEIVIHPDGDDDDHYFLTHAVMIAFVLATCGNGTQLVHASAVMYGGKAYLFQGRSGTGKSTHTSLWIRNIPGAELLNDDHPAIRFAADGRATVYGSPWSGKTHCYRNLSAPIGAFVRIVRAEDNYLRRLAPLKAYASLTASVFLLPFISDRLRDVRHRTMERMVEAVACCEMHCRPDADAAYTCLRGLTIQGSFNS